MSKVSRWRRFYLTHVERVDHQTLDTTLHTQGGFDDVRIHHDDTVIHIPRALLLDLMAEDYVLRQVERLESMGTASILARFYGPDLVS